MKALEEKQQEQRKKGSWILIIEIFLELIILNLSLKTKP